MLPELKDRIEILELVNRRYPGGIVVEVGAESGCFTRQMLKSMPDISKIYCIDVWQQQPDGIDAYNRTDDEQQRTYKNFITEFGENEKIVICKGRSVDMAKNHKTESVDFVYIDANHSTKACLEDLNTWWPKLRHGGIVAGHDYSLVPHPQESHSYGVAAAVVKFTSKQKLKVVATTNEFTGPNGIYAGAWEGFSFVIEKP